MASLSPLPMAERPSTTPAVMSGASLPDMPAEERAFQDSDVLLLQQQEQPTQPPPSTPVPAPAETQVHAVAASLIPEINSTTVIPDPGTSRVFPRVSRVPTSRGNTSHTKHLTNQDRARVRILYYDAGRTVGEIARITGFSKGQVRRGVERAAPGRRPGRPRKDGLNVVGHEAYVPGGFDGYINQKGVRDRRHRYHRPAAETTRKVIGEGRLPSGGGVGRSVESDVPGSIAALWPGQNDGTNTEMAIWPEGALGTSVAGGEELEEGGESDMESDDEDMVSAQEEQSGGEDENRSQDEDSRDHDDEDDWEDGEDDDTANPGFEQHVAGEATDAHTSQYLPPSMASKKRTRRVPDYPPPPRVTIDATKTIVLITDATSGIGQAIASALLQAYCKFTDARPRSGGPYHVFLAAANYRHARQTVDGLIKHHGNTVTPLQLDTRDPQSVTNAARMIHKLVGRVDIMVLNNCLNGMDEPQLNGSPVEIRPHPGPSQTIIENGKTTIVPGPPRKPDPVSIFRQTLEKTVMTSYALSEGLKWLLMAQSPPHTPPKVKRLIHITSPLCSISGRQIATHQGGTMAGVAGSGGGLGGLIPGGTGKPLDGTQHHTFKDVTTGTPKTVCVPVPALAEYRMALAALNMLVACQASAAHAAGVRVGVWNSGLLPTPPLPPREHFPGPLAKRGESNQETEKVVSRRARMRAWKKAHGGGPGVSEEKVEEAGKAFVRVVNGERDGDFGGLMDTFGGWLDW